MDDATRLESTVLTHEIAHTAAERRRHRSAHLPIAAGPSPLVDHVLTLQRQAGNRAVTFAIRSIQRRKPRGKVEVGSGEDILGAIALDDILYRRAGEERLAEIPPSARTAADKLYRCLHGRTPEGASLPVDEQLALYDAALPPLQKLLDRALAMSQGDLPAATHAKAGLVGLHTSLVSDRAQGLAWEAGKAAELVAPREKAERMKVGELARKTLDVYIAGQEILDKFDTEASLSKELRSQRIAALKGVIALCDADEWPSYSKFREELDKQLERTDPDRMLGAGASVLEQLKKATEWTTTSLSLMGQGMKSIFLARGMLEEAAKVGDALAGLEKLSSALAVVDVLHGAMVLLDSNASGSAKAEALLEITSGGLQITAAAAEAMGAETVAAGAAEAAPWAAAVTINYKAYKALAEYTYTNVVGGLSMVEVTNEMEGDPIFTKKGMFRPGGLDDLAKVMTASRLRVESLQGQLEQAAPGDRTGVQTALDKEIGALQYAIWNLQQHWSNAPLETIQAYMPQLDLGWQNAISPGAEPWMAVDEAGRWEKALLDAFVHKQDIVNATMHATMKKG